MAMRERLMRRIARLLIILAVGLALGGLFFGRASWIGMNSLSVPVWIMLELVALAAFAAGVAIHIRVSRG
jgi:hypothetical protein